MCGGGKVPPRGQMVLLKRLQPFGEEWPRQSDLPLGAIQRHLRQIPCVGYCMIIRSTQARSELTSLSVPKENQKGRKTRTPVIFSTTRVSRHHRQIAFADGSISCFEPWLIRWSTSTRVRASTLILPISVFTEVSDVHQEWDNLVSSGL